MSNCEYCYKYTEGFLKTPDLDKFLAGGEYHGDLNLRWERMNGIIDEILKKYDSPKIIDLATGCGCDSIALLKRGYNVISNDVNEFFIPIILGNAKENNVFPQIRIEDWRNFLNSDKYKDEEFDIAFILGNSFPNYLMKKEEREVALRGFWRILKHGGVLFFDTRNYDYILNDREDILKNPEVNFKYLGNTTFIKNNNYKIFPTAIGKEAVHFCVKNILAKQYDCKDLWPATENRVREMIENSVGEVNLEIFYDYNKEKPGHYDFIQYKLTKL
ncbi:MAG: class I SAM-dependent methyltransferase [Candidatus Paceibacterota bacterium]